MLRTHGSLYTSQVGTGAMVTGRKAKSRISPTLAERGEYYGVHSWPGSRFPSILTFVFSCLYQFQLMLNFHILPIHVNYLKVSMYLTPSH